MCPTCPNCHGCLPSVIEKQPSAPCLHARMPDVSCLCLMSWSWKLNDSRAISCSSFFHYWLFSPDHHLQPTCLVWFFVGADTPLSLDLSPGRTQLLAVVLHPFCYFSGTFIATVSHIHTGLKFFQTHSQLFPASPGLLLANKWPPMFLTGPPFYCRR